MRGEIKAMLVLAGLAAECADQPWYREIRPGLFEPVTTMRPAPAPRACTREQLMREYGFSRQA